MQLTTDRLLLRDIVFEDGAILHANSQHPEAQRYEEHSPLSADAFADITRWMIETQQTQPRTHYYFAIVLPDNPATPIGSIYLTVHDHENRQAETGYIMAVPQWGHGYTTEALREILRFGFEDLNIHRIYAADVIHENIASIRVLEKVGMRREGYFKETVFFKERWWDTLTFAILQSKWQQNKNSGDKN